MMDSSQHPTQAIEMVIFDCDGVIADSEILAIEALTQHFTDLGVDLEEGFVATHIVGKSFATVKQIAKDRLGLNLPADFEERYWASLAMDFEDKLQTTPDFNDVLNFIDKPYCVASNSNLVRVRKTLEILDLTQHFGANVFTATQVARGKPAPDLHEFAAKTMGFVPEKILVIEDSPTGVMAAQAAGMQVWRYVGASHFSASQRRGLLDTSEVPVFDSWSKFYELAPNLVRRA